MHKESQRHHLYSSSALKQNAQTSMLGTLPRCQEVLVWTPLAGREAMSLLWNSALILKALFFLQHHLLQKQRAEELFLQKKGYQPSSKTILQKVEAIFLTLERSWNLRRALTFKPLCIIAQILQGAFSGQITGTFEPHSEDSEVLCPLLGTMQATGVEHTA